MSDTTAQANPDQQAVTVATWLRKNGQPKMAAVVERLLSERNRLADAVSLVASAGLTREQIARAVALHLYGTDDGLDGVSEGIPKRAQEECWARADAIVSAFAQGSGNGR